MLVNITKGSKWLVVSGLILVLTISGLSLYESEDIADVVETDLLLPVSIMTLEPNTKKLTVNVTGVTQARWVTKLVAAVAGRVETLNDKLEPGMLIERNHVLLEQQDSAYQAAVDNAISQLAIAKLTLKKTLYEQTVAKNSKAVLHTPYARFEPQVQSARDSVTAAESALKNARQHLNDTKVRAPFSAIILERQVTPGQWLQAGQQLFLLADQKSIDVRVELSDSDWNHLLSTAVNTPAIITTNENEQWQGNIRYITPTRDRSTRQRSLIVKIDNPYIPLPNRRKLLPDTQVKIQFEGKNEAQIFVLASSSLTEDGDIWTLNQQDQLQLEKVHLLSQTAEEVVVRFDKNTQQQRRVVLYPLGSMIQGQKIKAIEGKQ